MRGPLVGNPFRMRAPINNVNHRDAFQMQTTAFDIDSRSKMSITILLNPECPPTLNTKMDISTCLNPLEEDERETQPMEVDSPAVRGTGSQLLSPGTPRTLPPLEHQQLPATRQESSFHNTLPPMKIMVGTVSPSPPAKIDSTDDSSKNLATLDEEETTDMKCRSPHKPRGPSTIGIVSSSQSQPESMLVESQSRPWYYYRHTHFNLQSPPRPFIPVPHQRPQGPSSQSYAARDGNFYRHLASAADNPHPGIDRDELPLTRIQIYYMHNNRPYTVEMIDWIRYHHVDLNMTFKSAMLPLFFQQFPDRYEPHSSEQTLSSRFYRDNCRPRLDEKGRWGVDENGILRTIQCKVRDSSTRAGKLLDFPKSLVDKWPKRLLCEKYKSWLSPIREEHRERAKQIVQGNDPMDIQGKRAEWRRILDECEHLLYRQ